MIAPTQALCFTGIQKPLNVSLRINCGTTCPVFLSDLVFLLVVFLLIACFTILQLLLMNGIFFNSIIYLTKQVTVCNYINEILPSIFKKKFYKH